LHDGLFDAFRDSRSAFGNMKRMLPVSSELHRYWRALKSRRSAPERNDVEPGAIRSILADTFMLEFDEDASFPLRISGSKANALFMRELRSLPFLELWREEDWETIRSALRATADESVPRLLSAEACPQGLESLYMEMLVLPLRHRGSEHSRMLGAIALEATPQWLGLIAAGPITLLSAHAIGEVEREAAWSGGSTSFGLTASRRQHRAGGTRERR
jgi:hypothetical protein